MTDLQSDGLVARSPDPTDGRRNLVALTAAGRETLAADRVKREGWLARSIDEELSAEEQHVLANAVPLMRRLLDR